MEIAAHDWSLSDERAKWLEVQVATVFLPRKPISTREFFAGRWTQITTITDAVGQPGLHVVIYGERGVGKTSLANVIKPLIEFFDLDKAGTGQAENQRLVIKTNASSDDTFASIWGKLFADLTWLDDRPIIGINPGIRGRISIQEAFGFSGSLGIDEVRRVVSKMPGSVFIIDEFDRAAKQTSKQFTDLMKAFSDFSVECTVALVGVAETVDTLVLDHASINRSLVQILLPRMKPQELREILTKAEGSLSIKFSEEATNLIVHISQGLPHYTHLLGLHTVRISAGKRTAYIDKSAVFEALKEAVRNSEQTVTAVHSEATHSSHKDALYRQVLLACALAAANSHDSLGYFNPGAVVGPLTEILGRPVQIATFSNHLSEFCDVKRAEVLERTGQSRAYRFRFKDPLLVPFVFMDAIAGGIIDNQRLADLLGEEF